MQFNHPKFDTFRTICNVLERDGRVMEAVTCFRRMKSELTEETSRCDERAQWEPGEWLYTCRTRGLLTSASQDFQRTCEKRLEELGDAAADSDNYVDAVEHFSTILSFSVADHVDILIKRSKTQGSMGSWDKALDDADKV